MFEALSVPLRELRELEVEDTEVEVEDKMSFDSKLLELRPRIGEDMAFKLMG